MVWFNSLDRFVQATFVIAILLIVSTPFIVNNLFSLSQNAASQGNLEAEDGSVSGSAAITADSQASGGKYVLFGAFGITGGPTAQNITSSSVDITWTLSQTGTGQVEYGTSTSYGTLSTPETSFNYTNHLQTIKGLNPNTLYHYRVKSSNQNGVQIVSADKTFTTAGGSVSTNTPTPTSAPSGSYAATYTASSSTDQTAALTSFINSHAHQRIAISGVIPVRRVDITIPAGAVTTIDFLPGSKIQEIQTGTPALLLYQSWDIVLNNPNIAGTGYTWITTTPEVEDPNQDEHAISIDSGGRITINNPFLRDTRGDGIYSGYDNGSNQPPVAIVVNNADIERSSRNGISPVAGEITIKGGHIDRSGLANIDFEPNNTVGSSSIKGTISDIRLTHHCDLPSPCGFGDYAIAGGGTRAGVKNNINIQRVTGDRLITAIWDTANVVFQNNSSDVSTTATFTNVGSVTFTGNSGITKQ